MNKTITTGNGKENTDNSKKKYDPTIENFICGKYSICREERQYVVFLYNILRYYSTPKKREKEKDVQKIFTVSGLEDDAVVEHVFFEATFMRDFFERNRRLRYSSEEDWETKLLNKKFTAANENPKIESFNKELIQFVYKQMCKEHGTEARGDEIEIESSETENNLGQNEIDFEKLKIGGEELNESGKKWIKYRVSWMMNVQPDIVVVYHTGKEKNTEKLLLFIECKFLSKESSYSYNDNNQKVNVKQRQIQKMVAEFLCGYLNKKNSNNKISLSPKMKGDKSHLVKFVRIARENTGEEVIPIDQLIKLNDGIFSPGHNMEIYWQGKQSHRMNNT